MYAIRLCLTFLICVATWRPLESKEPDEAASLIRALCTNLDSVREFDVVIEREELHDVPFHSIARTVIYTRIRYDREGQRAICASHARGVEESFRESNTSEPIRKTRLCGLQWAGGRGVIHEIPTSPKNVESLERAFRDLNIPDIRCVGLEPFPSRYAAKGDMDSFNNWRNTQLSSPALIVGKNDNQTSLVEFRPQWEAGGGAEFVQSWVFDLERLVPIRFERKVTSVESGAKKQVPVELQTIEWGEESGCCVPARILGRKSTKIGDSLYEIESTVYFHWLSVNKPLKDELFNRELIESDTALIRFSDPSSNGIKPLISN